MDERTGLYPVSWEEFLEMSKERQRTYIQEIIETFHVGIRLIARDLFNVSADTLRRYLKVNGMEPDANKGGRIPEATLDKWRKWVLGDGNEENSRNRLFSGTFEIQENGESIPESICDMIRTMHEIYGDIRVTLTISGK